MLIIKYIILCIKVNYNLIVKKNYIVKKVNY